MISTNQAPASENAKVFLIRSMAETLLYAKKNYYSGYCTISDVTYDHLEDEMKKICPKHPVLQAVGDADFSSLLGVVDTRKLVKEMEAPEEDMDDCL